MIILRSVVLPDPLGPSIPIKPPLGTRRVTPSTIGRLYEYPEVMSFSTSASARSFVLFTISSSMPTSAPLVGVAWIYPFQSIDIPAKRYQHCAHIVQHHS